MIGDNTTSKPGVKRVVARGIWDAWKSQKGTNKEDAAQKYVKLVKELLGIKNEPKEKK